MSFYEATLIARQEISPKDVEAITKKLSETVEKSGGKVVKSEYWGLRSLAYPINKGRKGHYAFLGIEGTSQVVNAVEKSLLMNEDVIRNLVVKVEEISKEPSAPLSNDNEPEEFSRDRDFDME